MSERQRWSAGFRMRLFVVLDLVIDQLREPFGKFLLGHPIARVILWLSGDEPTLHLLVGGYAVLVMIGLYVQAVQVILTVTGIRR